ncbi:DUF4062 domain-containing protein [Algiphilus aromaticivorans]|uniref:DUF4062 domain-containing protein n=1 Tax=Algiphilus aromaticivorans TaxID=382454 RepID=UPI000A06E01B
MPRNTTIIQVFVSSPSDVQHERDLLESIVDEHNATWSAQLGITFELKRWENDTRPAFGTDPQNVITSQIGDSFDVFIGILWGRFGTKTPRAQSGTQEEFHNAYQRFRETGAPEVMFYFKEAPCHQAQSTQPSSN